MINYNILNSSFESPIVSPATTVSGGYYTTSADAVPIAGWNIGTTTGNIGVWNPSKYAPSYVAPNGNQVALTWTNTATGFVLKQANSLSPPVLWTRELGAGYAAFVHPRSGLAARHGVTIVNAPGTVDAGYRGEIRVTLLNTDREHAVSFKRGDRIGQLIIQRLSLGGVLRVVEPPLQHIPLHHFLHERHRALVPRIEQVLRSMQASGELQQVRQDAVAAMLSSAKR